MIDYPIIECLTKLIDITHGIKVEITLGRKMYNKLLYVMHQWGYDETLKGAIHYNGIPILLDKKDPYTIDIKEIEKVDV